MSKGMGGGGVAIRIGIQKGCKMNILTLILLAWKIW